MPNEDKNRENRLRQTAKRQGLTLQRSARRDPRALDYGRYWLLRDNTAPEGPKIPVTPPQGITIGEIEEYLNMHPSERDWIQSS